MSNRWYVIATQPGRETIAEVHLVRQQFSVWMPQQERMVRHARKRVNRLVPFFPGYLFASLDLGRERWRSINGTYGVRSLVMQGDLPVPCPVGLVEAMRASTVDGALTPSLAVGDNVRIVTGPFADLVGRLVGLEGRERARVLLALMNSELSVSLRIQSLVSAAA